MLEILYRSPGNETRLTGRSALTKVSHRCISIPYHGVNIIVETKLRERELALAIIHLQGNKKETWRMLYNVLTLTKFRCTQMKWEKQKIPGIIFIFLCSGKSNQLGEETRETNSNHTFLMVYQINLVLVTRWLKKSIHVLIYYCHHFNSGPDRLDSRINKVKKEKIFKNYGWDNIGNWRYIYIYEKK